MLKKTTKLHGSKWDDPPFSKAFRDHPEIPHVSMVKTRPAHRHHHHPCSFYWCHLANGPLLHPYRFRIPKKKLERRGFFLGGRLRIFFGVKEKKRANVT